jgi:hypothetical protein
VLATSVVDGGSVSSFLPHCGSGSLGQTLPSPKGKFFFYMKNILYVGNRSYLNVGTKGFLERLEIRFVGKYWSISLLLDPDPHSQNGS